jgi:DNA-binding MarR family transcriptional regulator
MISREEAASHAWLCIARIFRSGEVLERFTAAANSVHLTPKQLSVLLEIPADRDISMRQLAEQCHLTPSFMTALIDGLVDRGLLRRQENREDRRTKLLTLTAKGREAVKRSGERLKDPPRGFEALTDQEVRSLHDLLLKAAQIYTRHPGF